MSLFHIENLIRVATHNLLVLKLGPNYFTEKHFPAFEITEFGKLNTYNLVSESLTKKNDEKKYKQNIGFDYPYLWYLDLSQLTILIEQFWSVYFFELFSNPKNIKDDLFVSLKRVRPIRNSIAHNRYLPLIEYNEIVSCYELVKGSLRKELLFNYEQLVFTLIENQKNEIKSLIEKITELILKYNFIDRLLIKNLQSTYTIYIQSINTNQLDVDKFSILIELLRDYNKLPRKPGVVDLHDKFINENKIELKLKSLVK